MKPTHTLLVLALVSGLGMAGCSSTAPQATSAPSTASTAEQANNSKQEAPKQEASSIKSGVEKMLAVSAELKKAIDAGDEAKVKATAPGLEDAWSSFEDTVKAKYPDLYKKVEDSLDPALAGAKATPLNKVVVGKLNDQVSQALHELAGKEK